MIIAIHERYKNDLTASILTASLSSMAILGKKKKSLVVQIKERAKYDVENININLADLRSSINDNELEVMEEGIEVFLREATIQTPAKNEFLEFSVNMLNEKGKYDVVSGFKTADYEHEFNRQKAAFENFLTGAKTVYDVIFILTGYTENEETIKNVDRLADASVYCTTQYSPARELFAAKSYVAVPEYFPESTFTLKNLGKRYGGRQRVFGIRQNTACIDQAIKGQFLPYIHSHKNDTEYSGDFKWMQDIKGMLDVIMGEKENAYVTEDLFSDEELGHARLQAVKKLRAVKEVEQIEYMKKVSLFKKKPVCETKITLGSKESGDAITSDGFEEMFESEPLTEEVEDTFNGSVSLEENDFTPVSETILEESGSDEASVETSSKPESVITGPEESVGEEDTVPAIITAEEEGEESNTKISVVDEPETEAVQEPETLEIIDLTEEETTEEAKKANEETAQEELNADPVTEEPVTEEPETEEPTSVEDLVTDSTGSAPYAEDYEDDPTLYVTDPEQAAEDSMDATDIMAEVERQREENEIAQLRREISMQELTRAIADKVYGTNEVPFVRQARITAMQGILYALSEKNQCLPQDIQKNELTVFVKKLNAKNFMRETKISQAAYGSASAFDMVVSDKRQKAMYIQQLAYIASMMWSNNYEVVGDFCD